MGWEVGGEGLSKKEEELMGTDHSVGIAEGGGARGLNGNEKNYNKDKIKKKRQWKEYAEVITGLQSHLRV